MSNTSTLPAVASGFQIQVTSFEQAWRLADMISQSELCPKAYRGKAGDCMTAMMMGAEVGLNPIQALQNIATINGKPSLYGDACLALVMRHPQFKGIDESFSEDRKTATCILRRGEATVSRDFSEASAKKAGLWGKVGPWQSYPERMLQMRARSWAIRDLFPDALAGLSVAEEVQDAPYLDNTPDSTATAQISAVLEIAELPQQEEVNAPESANKSVVEESEKKPEVEIDDGKEVTLNDAEPVLQTYAELRDKIERCNDTGELIGYIQDTVNADYLGKKQQKELKEAANARHTVITEREGKN